jgi:pantoate--beta-alanine ligase
MSSRNSYLNSEQRQAATVLYRALTAAQALFEGGERDAGVLRRALTATLAGEPLAKTDYVSIADPHTLKELEVVGPAGALVSLAVQVGPARLIDNMVIG